MNESAISGAMDDGRNENASSADGEIQGNVSTTVMENYTKVSESKESKWKRRMFDDLTNCQIAKSAAMPKQNVLKISPRQSTITEFAVVKYKMSNLGSSGKTIPEIGGSSKHFKWHDSGCFSLTQSDCEIDMEDTCSRMEVDSEHITCTGKDSSLSESVEMCRLQSPWNQTLRKRFNAINLSERDDLQQPLIKRRKENDERQLIRKFENDENEQVVKTPQEKSPTISERPKDDDISYETKYSLEIIPKPSILTAGFACIGKDVLEKLLRSMEISKFLQKYVLVDCRYPYEYDGGHIKGAVNIYDPVILEETFFPKCVLTFQTMRKKIPIFYCEYSSARGPIFASHLRKSDRVRNYQRYPIVHYKEIYVLEGGYNSFYNTKDRDLKDLCEPMGYVSMRAKEYSQAFKEYHTHSLRTGIGFETGMFQTAVIKKGVTDFRRIHSAPSMPDSPFLEAIGVVQSPEKLRPEATVVPMLVNPRTPTGRKSSLGHNIFTNSNFRR